MIKAIETQYKGYRFRSRLEARWAVVFDALDLAWVYEPEGYDLGGGVKYLPDFYTPYFGTDGAYIEIKPTIDAIRPDFQRHSAFAAAQERPLILLYDLPSQSPWGTYGLMLGSESAGVFAFAFTDYLFAFTVNDVGQSKLWRNPNEQFIVGAAAPDKPKGAWMAAYRLLRSILEHPHIVSAFQAGVQARFEHGENGAR